MNSFSSLTGNSQVCDRPVQKEKKEKKIEKLNWASQGIFVFFLLAANLFQKKTKGNMSQNERKRQAEDHGARRASSKACIC